MSYVSLFVGREKSVRCGSLCNERTYFCDNGKLPKPGGLPAVFGPDQYVM